MNSVTTPLLPMIDSSSAHPDKNPTSGALKPGGLLAADTLFNIHSEKKEKIVAIPIPAVPTCTVPAKKTEATTMTSSCEKITVNQKMVTSLPSTTSASSTSSSSSSSSSASSTSSTSAPSSSSAQNTSAAPPTTKPPMPYNIHLAALMRQYEIISQGSSKPSTSDAGSTKSSKPSVAPKIEAEKLVLPPVDKPVVPIQHIFPPPVRNLTSNSPLTTPISPLLNFAHPFAGYAWPMMPFANPFAPFMQCYPYPPQLSLLQNQFTFQQPTTPVSQQLAANGKKRKASPVNTTMSKSATPAAKRVKEIGNEQEH